MNFLEWIRKALTVGHGIVSLVLCLIFSGTLVSLDRPNRAIFHEVMVGTLLYPVQELFSHLEGTLHIYRENDSLLQENAALRVENDLLRQSTLAVPRLEEMERFRTATALHLKPAQVIAQDAGRLQMTWVIDLGRADSVDVNMPVLTSKGVVGKTAQCFRNYSVVQLISDPAFKAAVQDDRSRVRGILESYRLYRLEAQFPAGADVHPGDTLVTAGVGGVFPKGLRVGVTDQEMPGAETQNGDVLQTVLVHPFQELSMVEEVFVLIKKDSWQLQDSLP